MIMIIIIILKLYIKTFKKLFFRKKIKINVAVPHAHTYIYKYSYYVACFFCLLCFFLVEFSCIDTVLNVMGFPLCLLTFM